MGLLLYTPVLPHFGVGVKHEEIIGPLSISQETVDQL